MHLRYVPVQLRVFQKSMRFVPVFAKRFANLVHAGFSSWTVFGLGRFLVLAVFSSHPVCAGVWSWPGKLFDFLVVTLLAEQNQSPSRADVAWIRSGAYPVCAGFWGIQWRSGLCRFSSRLQPVSAGLMCWSGRSGIGLTWLVRRCFAVGLFSPVVVVMRFIGL